MKYEIEIDGLPEDIEPVAYAFPRKGDLIVKASTDQVSIEGPINYNFTERRLIVRRKTRKYDWSKTLDDVLTLRIGHEEIGLKPLHKQDAHYKIKLPEVWQPNVHGECPVDPEASIVRVRFMNGDEIECKAKNLSWTNLYHPATIASWQFIRLSDGYEW